MSNRNHKVANEAVAAPEVEVEVKETKMSKIKEKVANASPKAKKVVKVVGGVILGAGAAAAAFVAGRMTAPGNEDQYDDEYSDAPIEEAYAESEEE